MLCGLQVEGRLRQMEGRLLAVDSSKPRGQASTPKYDPARQGASTALLTEPKGYNTAADVTLDAAATQKPKVGPHSLLWPDVVQASASWHPAHAPEQLIHTSLAAQQQQQLACISGRVTAAWV